MKWVHGTYLFVTITSLKTDRNTDCNPYTKSNTDVVRCYTYSGSDTYA
ncbi:MAG: hypothetical protein F6K32_09455 [Desertifilum sp. SIO1I2]|nr:hypothetical protein [Desertifilum sp. SIO1I2]